MWLTPSCWRQFNPIELGFGWMKKYVRRHARKDGGTCTNRDVLKAIYDGVSALPRARMAGFFRKAGYDAPDPEKDDQESAVVVAAAAAAAVAAVAVILKRRK